MQCLRLRFLQDKHWKRRVFAVSEWRDNHEHWQRCSGRLRLHPGTLLDGAKREKAHFVQGSGLSGGVCTSAAALCSLRFYVLVVRSVHRRTVQQPLRARPLLAVPEERNNSVQRSYLGEPMRLRAYDSGSQFASNGLFWQLVMVGTARLALRARLASTSPSPATAGARVVHLASPHSTLEVPSPAHAAARL